VKAESVLV